MRLKGKVAVVAVAGRVVGEAIARRLAGEGAAVVVGGPDGALAASIVEHGGRAAHVAVEATGRDGARALVAAAIRDFGRMDVFVVGDGAPAWSRPAIDATDDEVDRMMAAGVRSLRDAVRACVPVWEAAGGGSMIVVASNAGLGARSGFAWPAAASAAAIAAVKALALEYGSANVRFNAVCPEVADAIPVATSVPAPAGANEGAASAAAVRFAAGAPLARAATPSDAAGAVVFLASDEAAAITGVALPVDGGRWV